MNFIELKKKTGLQQVILNDAQKQQIKGGSGDTSNPIDPTLDIGIIDTDII